MNGYLRYCYIFFVISSAKHYKPVYANKHKMYSKTVKPTVLVPVVYHNYSPARLVS